jgi:hypothetical protein
MPLVQVLLVLIVVGVLLWLVNSFIPMAGSIKSILNAVVVICVVVWLLNVFGLMGSIYHLRVPHSHSLTYYPKVLRPLNAACGRRQLSIREKRKPDAIRCVRLGLPFGTAVVQAAYLPETGFPAPVEPFR